MNNNKKGLSTIVATLLIILLTLVAVGIIWVVVRNVVQGGSEQIDLSTKCLATDVAATKVVDLNNTNFTVTLSRQGSGSDEIGGVKLAFTDANNSATSVVDVSGNIVSLNIITKNVTVDTTAVPNPSKVSVTVYFLDASGNEQLCPTPHESTF